MPEIADFALIVLAVCGGLTVAVAATRLPIGVPAPIVLLVAAAVVSDVFDAVGDAVTIREVERVQEGDIVSNEVWRRGPDGRSGPAGEFQVDTLRRLEDAGFSAEAWVSAGRRR